MVRDITQRMDPLREQLRGFARSIAEIEWLLLILVLLYLLAPGTQVVHRDLLILAMVVFAAFVIIFHYANFFRAEARWKIALETWVMIGFITVAVHATGGTGSVLFNLYLLAVIASALTLNRVTTLLEVLLIAACYVLMGSAAGSDLLSLAYFGTLMAELAPVLLIAYLTTMLASDVHRANDRIQVLAGSDELTGVLNMRGFATLLEREHGLAERHARTYTLVMIDVDHMKSINDDHGHEVGNRALRQVAAVLREGVRTTDAVARYGGDEFMLLLSESDLSRAREVIDRIREQLKSAELRSGGTTLRLQVSAGLANYPYNGTTIQELVSVADAAMYEEKNIKRKTGPNLADATPA